MPIVPEKILVDTGPLVAVLNAADEHHGWALEVFASLEAPLFTCEAVLSECQFLLEDRGGNPLAVLEWVQQGILKLDFSAGTEIGRLLALQRTYRNLPMDFADACLVRMTELQPRSRVLTTDSHFKIYRRNGRQQIPLLAPSRF
ncbi:MAG TPA: PIN domain-containing protein [Verrucomicrobiae bacterium]|nr:PIN domain-containing protein [Verrucomicrobiae bacterium]